MATDDNDEDLDEIFSFSVADSGINREPIDVVPNSATSTRPSSSALSDFDVLDDDDFLSENVLSTPGAAPAAADNAIETTSKNKNQMDVNDFDDIFGTPPITPVMPTEANFIDEVDTPKLGSSLPSSSDIVSAPARDHLSSDDFHPHDAGTRDFLEWLDDDDVRKKTNVGPAESGGEVSAQINGGENQTAKKTPTSTTNDADGGDDFDFDQILAEADIRSSAPSSTQQNSFLVADSMLPTQNTPSWRDKHNPTVDIADGDALVASFADGSSDTHEQASGTNVSQFSEILSTTISDVDGRVSPLPISKPYVSACIEEELSFDQWEQEEIVINGPEGTNSSPARETYSASNPSSSTFNYSGTIVALPSPTKVTFFSSLADAVRSDQSTIYDVRCLFTREKDRNGVNPSVSKDDRPYLWSKVVCGKVLQDLESGSLAESFRAWQNQVENVAKCDDDEGNEIIEDLLTQVCSTSKGDENFAMKKQALLSVLHFHRRDEATHRTPCSDPLIPPVVHAILSTGASPAAASVILSHIEPSAMPLLRLTHSERYPASKAMHSEFYLLACYHLPLLVMHLDRHCPGWYWPRVRNINNHDAAAKSPKSGESPKGEGEVSENISEPQKTTTETVNSRNPEANGAVPLSWFVSNFAGECGGSCLDHEYLLPLWDNILAKGDCSWKYFLAIAVLHQQSDTLLMLRAEELAKELEMVLEFRESSFYQESFVGVDQMGEENTSSPNDQMVVEWLELAKSLANSTPSSVIERLRTADDRAVADALKVRQNLSEEKLQAQLDKDAKSHEAALKKEREEREADAQKALIKARLVAYYRNHNPEKIESIDQIIKLFDGRMGTLNEKLKKKYGEGFQPDEAFSDHVTHHTRNFLVSVNQSINETKRQVAMTVAERRKRNAKPMTTKRTHVPVALEVSPTEVLPVICAQKGLSLAGGEKAKSQRTSSGADAALKFYLVDCRPESIAKEQGRFPTAVDLSPEKLQDPDSLQKLTDMFESLRGAVHICVMGEGFASFPILYDHPLTEGEDKLLEEDIARTSSCALFFLKKGFPFVSVLKGGFAAAHAFLSRKGPSLGMTPSQVLIDYDPVVSLFAQLEMARQEQEEYKNAPAREKTAKTLQKIIDNSMMRLTLEEQRINDFAIDLARPETMDRVKQSVSNFFSRSSHPPPTLSSSPREGSPISFARTPPLFMKKHTHTNLKVQNDEYEHGNETTPSDVHEVGDDIETVPTSDSAMSATSELSPHGDAVSEGTSSAKDNETGLEENDFASEHKAIPESSSRKFDSNVFVQFRQRLKIGHAANARSEEGKSTDFSSSVSRTFSAFTQRTQDAKIGQDPQTGEIPANHGSDTDKSTEIGMVSENNPELVKNPFSSLAQKLSGAHQTNSISSKSSSLATEEETVGSAISPESSGLSGEEAENNLSAPGANPNMLKNPFAGFAQRITMGQHQTDSRDDESQECQDEGKSDGFQDQHPSAKSTLVKNPFVGFSQRKATINNPIFSASSAKSEESSTRKDSVSREEDAGVLESVPNESSDDMTQSSHVSSESQPKATLRNPFTSLIQLKSNVDLNQSPKGSTSAQTSNRLLLGQLLRENNDSGSQENPGLKKFGFGMFGGTTNHAESKYADSEAFSPSEESILFQLDSDDSNDPHVNSSIVDVVAQNGQDSPSNFGEIEDIITEADESKELSQMADLFCGLTPQPQGDPTQDLFDDVLFAGMVGNDASSE